MSSKKNPFKPGDTVRFKSRFKGFPSLYEGTVVKVRGDSVTTRWERNLDPKKSWVPLGPCTDHFTSLVFARAKDPLDNTRYDYSEP